MYIEKQLADLEKVLEYLRNLDDNIPVIVEGINDIKALRNIEIEREIISINQGLSLVVFAEEVAKIHKVVILLTDWDFKGRQLLKELRKQFRALGVKVIDEIWVQLMKYAKKDITCIEDLDKLVARLRSNLSEGHGHKRFHEPG